jgi:hypothetical protein
VVIPPEYIQIISAGIYAMALFFTIAYKETRSNNIIKQYFQTSFHDNQIQSLHSLVNAYFLEADKDIIHIQLLLFYMLDQSMKKIICYSAYLNVHGFKTG